LYQKIQKKIFLDLKKFDEFQKKFFFDFWQFYRKIFRN